MHVRRDHFAGKQDTTGISSNRIVVRGAPRDEREKSSCYGFGGRYEQKCWREGRVKVASWRASLAWAGREAYPTKSAGLTFSSGTPSPAGPPTRSSRPA